MIKKKGERKVKPRRGRKKDSEKKVVYNNKEPLSRDTEIENSENTKITVKEKVGNKRQRSSDTGLEKIDNEKIKLNSGDIIIEVNREIVESVKSFTSLVEKYKETGRSSLLLKIKRGEETSWVTIKFVNS